MSVLDEKKEQQQQRRLISHLFSILSSEFELNGRPGALLRYCC